MQVSAIILAAGKGLRLKSRISKPLIKLNSLPLIIYSLRVFASHPKIKEIILVANSKNEKGLMRLKQKYRIAKIKNLVRGGIRRQDSVNNGLRVVSEQTDLVLIHDGVRPFISRKLVSALIKEARSCGAAIAGVPLKATVKQVRRQQSGFRSLIVEKTLERSRLWEIQTPQVFRKGLLLQAFSRFGKAPVTDEAGLVEKLGATVRIVPANYFNIKVTTPEDLVVAEAILQTKDSRAKTID